MTEMFTLLNTPDDPAHDAMVEKKSEFIGDACHVDSLDEALAFVEAIRERHPKSRHVAYAAICGGADGQSSSETRFIFGLGKYFPSLITTATHVRFPSHAHGSAL